MEDEGSNGDNKKLSRFGSRIGSGASQENLYDFEVLSEGREIFVNRSDSSLVARSQSKIPTRGWKIEDGGLRIEDRRSRIEDSREKNCN